MPDDKQAPITWQTGAMIGAIVMAFGGIISLYYIDQSILNGEIGDVRLELLNKISAQRAELLHIANQAHERQISSREIDTRLIFVRLVELRGDIYGIRELARIRHENQKELNELIEDSIVENKRNIFQLNADHERNATKNN